MVPGPRDTTYADGAILRQLHEMLRKEDPGFADLRKVPDRHGQWRWVPRQFVQIFQRPLPDILTGHGSSG
jgi:hypothetical protein